MFYEIHVSPARDSGFPVRAVLGEANDVGLGVVAQSAGKHCALADGQADGRESVASRAPRGPGTARGVSEGIRDPSA